MPAKYVPPTIFVIHDKCPVYHTYKDSDWSRRLQYTFALNEWDPDEATHFDVRDLSTWDKDGEEPEEERIKKAICAALDSGEIKGYKLKHPYDIYRTVTCMTSFHDDGTVLVEIETYEGDMSPLQDNNEGPTPLIVYLNEEPIYSNS